MRLQGKVAIITGGGAGIGRACVELFAREGAHVVIAELDAASGEAARDAVAKQGGGSIVNASSIYGLTGTPNRDAYTAAKGAITALTRSMAVEFAKHNLRVNAVAAAGTTTERVLKRMEGNAISQKVRDAHLLGFVDPVDVAHAVLYLASDESRTTTGHILPVDSGYLSGRG